MNLDVFWFSKESVSKQNKLYDKIVRRASPTTMFRHRTSDCFVVCRQIQLQSLTDPLKLVRFSRPFFLIRTPAYK